MNNVELPYFGQIDFDELNEYYYTETVYDDLTLCLDINLENKKLSIEEAKNIIKFLLNISSFDIQNKSEIIKDFNNKGETEDYINFYFEELDEEELNEIIGYQNLELPKVEQFLSKLKLIRVGLYPDGKYDTEYYAVFDYSIEIDGVSSNQLLVIKTNDNGELDHITWES